MLTRMKTRLPWSTQLLILGIESLPSFTLEPLARLMAFGYRTLAPRKLRRAIRNLEIAFGDQLDPTEIDLLARKSLVHQAIALLESIRELRKPGAVQIEGFAGIQSLAKELEQGEGGQLFLTAHIGAWEFVNRAGTQAATGDFFALAKEPKQESANLLLDHLRESGGMEVLPSGRKSTLKRMLEVLKRGGWLGLAMDQKPDGPGIPVEFFGRTTEFVVGPAALIERQGSRALVAFCIRLGNGKYRLLGQKLLLTGGESRQEITQKMASLVEDVIRQHPEQWLWTYRRWPDVR